MSSRPHLLVVLLGSLAASAVATGDAATQEPSPPPPPAVQPGADTLTATEPVSNFGTLLTLGTLAEERLRIDQILGRADTDGYLVRSASTMNRAEGDGALHASAIFASATSTWNSALPFSQNDGALWTGRGLSWMISGGLRLDVGRLSLLVAPEITYQGNADFQTILYNRSRNPDRHRFSNPWYDQPESIDMPSRFGSSSAASAGLGQSSLTVDLGPVATGAATENLWWGPGIRNAIVMSNHAGGIPHLFLRTSRPLRTPLGEVEGRWILGWLAESDYFDSNRGNDQRSLSALAVTLRPAFDPGLTLGAARSVYAATGDDGVPPIAAFDVLRHVGRPNARSEDDLLREPGADQLFSLFGRWVFPQAGFEIYGEWARNQQPASLRELLVIPQHSQGYTLGLQWAHEFADSSVLRFQGETTYLEPSSTGGDRRTIGWYTSRPVRQGYTHRGQVIGAAIGPGSSSQWFAADYFPQGRARVGLYAGRIRWDNHSFYASGFHPYFAHDVSLLVGIKGAYRVGNFDLTAEFGTEGRMNYLYQSDNPDWDATDAVDIRNHSLRIGVTPVFR